MNESDFGREFSKQQQNQQQEFEQNRREYPLYSIIKSTMTKVTVLIIFLVTVVFVAIQNFDSTYLTDSFSLKNSGAECGNIGNLSGGDMPEDVRHRLRACAPERVVQLAALQQPEGALALLEVAAQKKHGPAARRIAEMYDPEHWSKQSSPFSQPNQRLAHTWYQRAESFGDPIASERLRRPIFATLR